MEACCCPAMCVYGGYLWVFHALKRSSPWQDGCDVSIMLFGISNMTSAALPPPSQPEMTLEPQLDQSGVAKAVIQHSRLSLQRTCQLSTSRLSLMCRTPFHPTRSGLSVTPPPPKSIRYPPRATLAYTHSVCKVQRRSRCLGEIVRYLT